jgi:hypothetical protein
METEVRSCHLLLSEAESSAYVLEMLDDSVVMTRVGASYAERRVIGAPEV